MKRSEVVITLANIASKTEVKVTPSNMADLQKQWQELFTGAAALINELEAQEKDEEEEVNEDSV